MGLLNLFQRNGSAKLIPIPKGSFTVDRFGRIMTSTLPGSFPQDRLIEVGQKVVLAFHGAREAGIPINELLVQFTALKLHARELRGGAIVFLTPNSPNQATNPK